MQPLYHSLKNGSLLEIRPAEVKDARSLLDYIDAISRESDFLTFGPDEFVLSLLEEEEILRRYLRSDNQLYLVGLVDNTIVASLTFSASERLRLRHTGELSMSVRKKNWGLGIGSLLLDTLIDWARENRIITKINLRVRTDNQRAILLYRHKGFVVEGEIHRAVCLDGEYYDHFWMGLEL